MMGPAWCRELSLFKHCHKCKVCVVFFSAYLLEYYAKTVLWLVRPSACLANCSNLATALLLLHSSLMATTGAGCSSRLQEQGTPTMEHPALCLDGILEHILRFMPQSERLRCCSVCKRWQAAALAVTHQEGLLLQPVSALSEAWLGSHGVGLQALVVHTGSLCANGDTSSVASLGCLTRLELNSVTSKPVLLKAIGEHMQVRPLMQLAITLVSRQC